MTVALTVIVVSVELTDVELLNGAVGFVVAVVVFAAAVVVHAVEIVVTAVAVVDFDVDVVLGFGRYVVEPMLGTGAVHGRHAHCRCCTTAGLAEISPWPSSTRPPKAAYPPVVLACTCTPYLRLREKMPRSGDKIDEHADQVGTLEKSSSAPIALV